MPKRSRTSDNGPVDAPISKRRSNEVAPAEAPAEAIDRERSKSPAALKSIMLDATFEMHHTANLFLLATQKEARKIIADAKLEAERIRKEAEDNEVVRQQRLEDVALKAIKDGNTGLHVFVVTREHRVYDEIFTHDSAVFATLDDANARVWNLSEENCEHTDTVHPRLQGIHENGSHWWDDLDCCGNGWQASIAKMPVLPPGSEKMVD